MILTTCAACAKPIDHDASSRCVACETRYCSDRCQRYDRRRGGHGKICGAIASGGGAEQYHANKKYEEAVADAVEECAEDTAGQTCFICMDGDAGGAHPTTAAIERYLCASRDSLYARGLP